MVDIVVTYLNERDIQWRENFNYWKNKEVSQGKAKLSNRQAFGVERTREWDAFKYWFRAVEKNCKWLNKVFLVVQNERHVPEWLKKDHPKLRIVYHEEYIPQKLLPTFNAMTIALFIGNIKDLSENFVMSDDDYYFLNEIKEDRFFIDGKPLHPNNKIPYRLYGGEALKNTDRVFFHILNNSFKFETKYMKEKVKYGFYHLPEARLKSFDKKIIDENLDYFIKCNSYSKFRHKTNLCSYLYSDLLKICGKALIGDPYRNCAYRALKSDVNFDDYKDKDMVCFNDTEQLDDYNKTKEKFIKFLDSKFPEKSSFEI